MERSHIKIAPSDGGEFDLYLATPDGSDKAPAMRTLPQSNGRLAVIGFRHGVTRPACLPRGGGLRGEDERAGLRRAA